MCLMVGFYIHTGTDGIDYGTDVPLVQKGQITQQYLPNVLYKHTPRCILYG